MRPELTELGRIKQVPLRALDCDAICGYIELQFRSPMGVGVKLSSPWNPFCDVSLVFITVEFTELESI